MTSGSRGADPIRPKRSGVLGLLPLVLALTLVWGTNWVLFPLAVGEVSVWTFRAICLLGSGSLLLTFARIQGTSLYVPRGQRKHLVIAALAYLVVWNIGSTYSATLIPSGQAAVLGFTMPLWATLFSWIFLGERPSGRLIMSVALASSGIALLAFAARHSYASAPLGFVLGLSAGVGWAAGTLVLKRVPLSVPPLVSTGWQLLIAGVPILAVAIATGSHGSSFPSAMSVIVIGYITIIPMALGNAAWFSIAHRLPANISGLATVMVPIVAMVTGALVRGEPLGPIQLAAMACCATSLLVVVVRPRHGGARDDAPA